MFGHTPKIVNWLAYIENMILAGTVTAELPEFEKVMVENKGSGMLGETESPVPGHFKKMNMKITIQSETPQTIKMFKKRELEITLNSSSQEGALAIGTEIFAKGTVTKFSSGKLETGQLVEKSIEISLTYIKIEKNGVVEVEYDPHNMICIIDGEDILALHKLNLGM